jgi:hypothetical protein
MAESKGKGPKRAGRMIEVTCVRCDGKNSRCSLCSGTGKIRVPATEND